MLDNAEHIVYSMYLFKCLDEAVREDGRQFTLHNYPAILSGVPTTQRKNDLRLPTLLLPALLPTTLLQTTLLQTTLLQTTLPI